MQTINQTELNVRIHTFISKKLQKYPNLSKADKIDAKSIWRVDKLIEKTIRTFGETRPDYSIKAK